MNIQLVSPAPWLLPLAFFSLALAGGWLILRSIAPTRRITRWALSLLAGLMVALTTGYVLGAVGGLNRLHVGLLWVWLACAVLWQAGSAGRRSLLYFALVSALGAWLLARGPEHGPWLAGGWDPGVYANEGACAARTGTFNPAPVSFYQQLGSDHFRHLTTDERTHRDVFPGIPAHINEGSIYLQFPRLTSVAFAVVHLMGGSAAGWRTPLLLAALAVWMWWAVAAGLFSSRWAALTAGLLLATHPLLLYHAHTPASELLELVLVAGLLLLHRAPVGMGRTVGMAWLLAAASANRTSFVLFGALFLLLLAALELARPDRQRVLFEHALLVVALAVGAASHHVVTPVAVAKLQHVLPRLEWTSCVLALAALLVDVGAGGSVLRQRLVTCLPAAVRWSVAVGIGALTWWSFRAEPAQAERLAATATYFGPAMLALAGAGLFLVVWRGVDEAVRLPLLWTLAVTLIVVRNPHVAELYPWATKRFLAFSLPLAAVGAAVLVQSVSRASRVVRWPVLALTAVVVFMQLPRGLAAWRAASYDGMPAHLAEVAAHLTGADGVVADHFLWATPLALTWGCPVVNGETLWREPEAESTRAVWDRLRALRDQGREILVLTSTEVGPEVWGSNAPTLYLRWSGPPVHYRETLQHRSGREFTTREKQRVFRVYGLSPEAGHGG